MPVSSHTHRNRGRLARASSAILLIASALPGCQTEPKPYGKREVWATYSMGVLSTDFPQEVRVPAVLAAGRDALTARGYTITGSSWDGVTMERGTVTGKPPNAGPFKSVVVGARLTGYGTRAWVEVRPVGDEAASWAIMDEMLRRLGY